MLWHSQEPLSTPFGILITIYTFYDKPACPRVFQEKVNSFSDLSSEVPHFAATLTLSNL